MFYFAKKNQFLETKVKQDVFPNPSGETALNRKIAQLKPFNVILDKSHDLKVVKKKSVDKSSKKTYCNSKRNDENSSIKSKLIKNILFNNILTSFKILLSQSYLFIQLKLKVISFYEKFKRLNF